MLRITKNGGKSKKESSDMKEKEKEKESKPESAEKKADDTK